MRVLFANPPWGRSEDHVASSIEFSFPPLGLLQLGSYAKTLGLKVRVVDNIGFGYSLKQFLKRVKQFNPHLVCLTASTTTFNNCVRTVKALKSRFPGVKVVVGGPHVSVLPEQVLREGADFVVRGEGERTFEELVREISSEKNFSSIKGLSFRRKEGEVVNNPDRCLIEDLDSLPFPDRELVPIHDYVSPPGLAVRDKATNMITSRGCPFRCSFCSNAVFGKTFRPNSAERMLAEARYLKGLGFEEVFFNDDVFTLDKKRTVKFCEGIKEEGLAWSCSTRADCLDRELVRKMKKAGCHTIGFGVESSDQEFLDAMKKDINLRTIEKAIRVCKEEGLNVKAYYLIGYSKEVEKNAFRDLRHAIKHGVDYVKFALLTPYPGTKLHDEWEEEGLLVEKGWEGYDGGCLLRNDVNPKVVRSVYDRVYAGFYFRPQFIVKKLLTTRSFRELKSSFHTFKSLLRKLFQ